MAIVRTAGTEIIRSIHKMNQDNAGSIYIFGEAHHIYTVLSIICFANSVQAAGNFIAAQVSGYDAHAGSATQDVRIFQQDMQSKETFVFNDKFSFMGHGPLDWEGTMNSIDRQNAIADQGGSVQQLMLASEHADDNFYVTVTYIDQNNS